MRHLVTGGADGGKKFLAGDFRITQNAETHVVNPFAGAVPRDHARQRLVITPSSSMTIAATTRPLFAFHGDAACAMIATKKTA